MNGGFLFNLPACVSVPPQAKRVVNVASIPQRSPFRYPGGKTWLVPTIRQWLASLRCRPACMVEPFAGGGIVSLTAVSENLTARAIMVEIDEEVAAVWKTILNGGAKWLARQILLFELTPENARRILESTVSSEKEKAFNTILKNRISHGGILAKGAGFIKNGESGRGINSRWYPKTLSNRIETINHLRDRITFIEGDGIKIIEEYKDDSNCVFFIDPPYTAGGKKAGTRLYKHSELDHEKLFAAVVKIKGDFLMTYDDAVEIRGLAKKHGFPVQTVPMRNTHNTVMHELLIARNFNWLDN